MSRLRRVFETLYAEALARAADDRRGEASRRLGNGATVAVRAQGVRRQVLLGRQGAPVGEAEVVTFRRDGGVPGDAERRDYAAGRWHYVALTWEEGPGLFGGEMPAGELPATL